MTKYDEIYLIASLLAKAKANNNVEFDTPDVWESLRLSNTTVITDDYLFELNEHHIIDYQEIGEEGFTPIILCSVRPQTDQYLRQLIQAVEIASNHSRDKIKELETRIEDILMFNPQRLSQEISATEATIAQTREQLLANPVLAPLLPHLDQIETHFKSISQVANHYEDVYKNIIKPVKEEGRFGIRQTVKWAVISIIVSTLLSALINWLTK